MSVLTADDIRHPVWHKIKCYLDDKLETLRVQNDEVAAHDVTIGTRAEIRAVKNLLRLGEITEGEMEEPGY